MYTSNEPSEHDQYNPLLFLSRSSMNSHPPQLFKFDKELLEDGQLNDMEDYPFSTTIEKQLPPCMMQSEQVKQIEVLEAILAHHRCTECKRF